MKKIKNFAAIIVLAIAIAPVMLVFNEDVDKIYVNLIAFVYAVLLARYGKRLAPPFVRDYLED